MPAVQEAIERVRNIDIDQYKYGFVTDIESDKAPRVIQMTVCSVRAWLPGMSVDPLTYIALKFPAPVCNACGIPMVTVTMVFDHATPEAKKVISYHCQKCGSTLGEPLRRAGREPVVLPFSHPA